MTSDNRSAIYHIGVWVGIVAVVCLMTWILKSGVAEYMGAQPKPVRVSTLLAFASIALFASAALILLYFSLKSEPIPAVALGVAGIAAFTSFGFAAVSASPGFGSIVAKDIVAGDVGTNTPPRFGIPIFFENNSDILTNLGRQQIENLIEVFTDCRSSNTLVRGFASSARFADDSDDRNRNLANRRASAVAEFLTSRGFPVQTIQWKSFAAMASEIRVIDQENGQRLILREPSNRRVEVLWDQSPCANLGSKTNMTQSTM